MLYPFLFQSVFKERVWGGRRLESLYRKRLPPNVPIGESWEISDRPGDASVITNGSLAGKDLRWLMEQHGRELLGDAKAQNGRFPLLVKILDAEQKLSLQVHPPAHKAVELGGEPKTELWYITQATSSAELYVGLRRDVTREGFELKIKSGEVADCFHRVAVHAGDAMFLPSGRVHALGAGIVLFEIQQNSDTTYRVFDWNRVGLDGKPRELHVSESLASIEFNDFEPSLVNTAFASAGRFRIRPLVKDRLFSADIFRALSAESIVFKQQRLRIIGVLEKKVIVMFQRESLQLSPGEFCLIPACLDEVKVDSEIGSSFLLVEPGK